MSTNKISFFVPGKPQGKGRPRFSARGGYPRAYTDSKTKAYETLIRAYALDVMPGGCVPQPGPFDLKITASFAPPASWSKKRRAAAMDQYHTVKPDLDNILKAVCDGLNNLIWFDDSSIAHIFIKKIYAEPEGLKIVVGWGDFLLDRAETAA